MGGREVLDEPAGLAEEQLVELLGADPADGLAEEIRGFGEEGLVEHVEPAGAARGLVRGALGPEIPEAREGALVAAGGVEGGAGPQRQREAGVELAADVEARACAAARVAERRGVTA
jgi:hypothetical protein